MLSLGQTHLIQQLPTMGFVHRDKWTRLKHEKEKKEKEERNLQTLLKQKGRKCDI